MKMGWVAFPSAEFAWVKASAEDRWEGGGWKHRCSPACSEQVQSWGITGAWITPGVWEETEPRCFTPHLHPQYWGLLNIAWRGLLTGPRSAVRHLHIPRMGLGWQRACKDLGKCHPSVHPACHPAASRVFLSGLSRVWHPV